MSLLRDIARGEANIDFVGRWKVWFAFSGVLLALSLAGLFGRGLNLGQEFSGGTSLRVISTVTVTIDDVERALAEFSLEDVKIQLQSKADPLDSTKEQQEILVRSAHIEDRRVFVAVQEALATVAGRIGANDVPDVDQISIDDVGPTWGRQVSSKALQGLIIFLILVTFYITVRFEWKMAIGALVALFHDLLATAGIYALVGFVVTPATVIALLTLLGYSLYDTVVVFDKVKENAEAMSSSKAGSYAEVVNTSANQVAMRSINTSLSTMLPIGSLLFVGVFAFGADTLKDLALAMFIGTIVGTYSSLFVAVPTLALLKGREGRYRPSAPVRPRPQARKPRKPTPAPAAPASEPTVGPGADVDVMEEGDAPVEDAKPARAPTRVPRGPGAPKPRRQKRGKRRR